MSFINAFLKIIGQIKEKRQNEKEVLRAFFNSDGYQKALAEGKKAIMDKEKERLPTIEKREAWFVDSKSFNTEAEARKHVLDNDLIDFINRAHAQGHPTTFHIIRDCRSRIEQYYRELDAGMTDEERRAKEQTKRALGLANAHSGWIGT